MSTETTSFSLTKEKTEARLFGIASAILLGINIFVPITIVRAFVLLGLAVTGWQFIFHGSTAISLKLQGEARLRFQVFISVAVPTLLSLYFIRNVQTVNIKAMLGHMVSPWYLLPIGLIAYVSWAATNYLDKEHPFRGFLISCAVIFVICYLGHHGIYSEYHDYTESSSTYIDEEAARTAIETGRYFGQFLVYVAVSYGVMLLRRRRK